MQCTPYYLTDRIQTLAGVQDVIPTKKVTENGKFYFLEEKMKSTEYGTL
jgi:hypothetical protein